jgi:hypothetical protein
MTGNFTDKIVSELLPIMAIRLCGITHIGVHLHIYSYRRVQYAPSIILEMHITIPAVRILINENR